MVQKKKIHYFVCFYGFKIIFNRLSDDNSVCWYYFINIS